MTSHGLPAGAPDAARLASLLQSLATRHGFSLLSEESFPAFAQSPGDRVVLLTEDPARSPESWDLAVILPELVSLAGRRLEVGLLPVPGARAASLAHGVRSRPALLFLRDGGQVGVIEGLRDWAGFAEEIPQLLAREAGAFPATVIPILAPARPSC
jgi:hydrogenase-1 operon protein HyaE